MAKFKKHSVFLSAVGMIVSALLFVISWVSIFIEIPQIKDWRIGILLSFVLFVAFVIWRFVLQENKIKQLERNLGDVFLPQLFIEPFNDTYSAHRSGVTIYNPTSQSISNMRIELTGLYWLENTKHKSSLIWQIPETNRLFTYGYRFDNFSIDKNDKAIVYLVEVRKNTLWFLLRESFPNEKLHWESVDGEPKVDFKPHKTHSFITKGSSELMSIFTIDLRIRGTFENGTPIDIVYNDWIRFGNKMTYYKDMPDKPFTEIYLTIGKQNLIDKGYIPPHTN